MTENQNMSMKSAWIDSTHSLRAQVLDWLQDADLAFGPDRQNPPLGEICRRMGDVQHSYTQSFHSQGGGCGAVQ